MESLAWGFPSLKAQQATIKLIFQFLLALFKYEQDIDGSNLETVLTTGQNSYSVLTLFHPCIFNVIFENLVLKIGMVTSLLWLPVFAWQHWLINVLFLKKLSFTFCSWKLQRFLSAHILPRFSSLVSVVTLKLVVNKEL